MTLIVRLDLDRYGQDVLQYQKNEVLAQTDTHADRQTDTHTQNENITTTTYAGGQKPNMHNSKLRVDEPFTCTQLPWRLAEYVIIWIPTNNPDLVVLLLQ